MNAIVLLDLVSTVAYTVAFVFLAQNLKKRLPVLPVIFLLLCMLIYMLVGFFNILEHAGITSYFDIYEDYLEIIFVFLFTFALYSLYMGREILERTHAEGQVRKSLSEKEVLLKEVHHRVKNNMAIIAAFLRLQASSTENEKTVEMLEESQNRIRAMALIHERLYEHKDFSTIDFREYVDRLVGDLIMSYGYDKDQIAVRSDIDAIHLPLDTLIPFGLIINELVTNSLKYAFGDRTSPEIDIKLKRQDGTILLIIGDNGCGLPANTDIRKTPTLGLKIVHQLARQLDAEVETNCVTGTEFRILFHFPDKVPSP